MPKRQARKSRSVLRAMLALIVATSALLAFAGSASAAPDSKGTEHWLAFPNNLGTGELSLFITGDVATAGTVEIPGLSFSQPFTVTPGAVTTVTLPSSAQLTASDGVEDRGIHVTSAAEVTVYGLNRIQFTTDAYLGLPSDILTTEYIVLGWKNVDIVNGTEFAVVGTQDATTVTITPSVTTGSHPAGTPFNVSLNQGQAYQLMAPESGADLSGTIVTSDKPVAVFGGHQCANIPNVNFVACDHVVEQITPSATWGRSFVTVPLATRTGGDTFRILASEDNTSVSIDGSPVATLNRGQLHEQLITSASVITADKPVLVAQYSNSSSFDGVTSDPFMMLIPPFEQFLASYTVTTPASGFSSNFINLAVPNSAVGSVTLDGTAVPPSSFTPIGSSGFSSAQLSVDLGTHTLEGPSPFGAFMYGFADFDSYGYPGGLSLAPVARVTSVVLSPETATNAVGTQHCVSATVTDQDGNPLEGVRVDFTVTGDNPTTGFANTNASGVAEFCYTGTNEGSDTITGAVGGLSDTATKTWTSVSLPLSTTKTADAASSLAGGSNGYTISISNPNPNAVTLDSITDTLPPGFTYTPGSTTGATTTDPSISGQALTWSGPISVPGASGGNPGTVSLHFNVTVSSTPGDFFNNAGATSTDFTVAPTGDTAPITVTQPQLADLSVTKSDSPDPVDVGGNLTYILTVQNGGPQDATGVTVTDTLPPGVVFGSATPSQGSCSQAAGVVTCTLGDLANGAGASIDIAVSAPQSAGTITNAASVSGNQGDPDTGNNSASEDTTVQAAQPGPGIPCEIAGKGKLTADNGDRASFKIDVESGATPSGRLSYRDHGPAAPFKLKSTAIDQVAVSADGSEATIEGTATIHGGGSVGFTVTVKDLPKAPDTFQIQLSNGYDSGEQTITRGDVDIECECEVEGDGKIRDAFDSQAKFEVDVEAIPPAGKVRYRVEGSRLKSTEITALTVSADEREASIQGEATIDGEGPFEFTVDVKDLPKAPDTFRIQLGNGYDSGEQTITRGDVDVECDGRCHKRGHKR